MPSISALMSLKRTRPFLLIIVGMSAAVVALLAILALSLWQPWASKGVSLSYSTEEGSAAQGGIVDSPLKVTLYLPSSTGGTYENALSLATLELLDDSGNHAEFGGKPSGSLPMNPIPEIDKWQYSGSVPTRPGTYHARVTMV